jgi:hypothetical protein
MRAKVAARMGRVSREEGLMSTGGAEVVACEVVKDVGGV